MKTRPPACPARMSKNLYSFASLALCTVPACTRSNLIAPRGSDTRATRGHRPDRRIALTRPVWLLFVLSNGVVGVLPPGTRFNETSDDKNSDRRVLTSRIVEGEMKFYTRLVDMQAWQNLYIPLRKMPAPSRRQNFVPL